MRQDEMAPANGRAPSPDAAVDGGSELERLRVACRRQANVIELLSAAVSTLRGGAAALKAENAEFRAAHERVPGNGARVRAGGGLELVVPAMADQVGRLRDAARTFAAGQGVACPDDVALAVHEACANTALHPDRAGSPGPLVLTAACEGDLVTFVIEDRSYRLAAGAESPGFGLAMAIVAQLTDAFELQSSETDGTRLRLAFAARRDEQRSADSQPIHAAAALAAVARDNQRLAARAEAALHETERSRARLFAAAAQERRRIERDLHDGAQERLIALRIGLTLAQEMAMHDPERCAARLEELGRELEEALEELRSLAHGVCPPLLADRGLVDAMTAAARHSAVPVELHTIRVERYAPEVETSVYFSVVEALQNVAKHARGARGARVELDGHRPGELRFEVRDDGAGTTRETLQRGAGITNMRDRIHAIGGELVVTSRPGDGTVVRGTVPLPTAHVH